MALVKNMLLRDRENRQVYRLLDEVPSPDTHDTTATLVVLIDINDARAIPAIWGKQKTLERVADGELIVVEEVRESINLSNLSPAENTKLERRWQLVSALLPHRYRLYDADFRGAEARRLAEAKVASKPFFYTTLRLFWQRGGGKASLVTDYYKCGRPGEKREAVEGAPKPGRPRTIQPGIGVAATALHRVNMRIGWSRAPVGRDGRGLRSAYDWMLITRYSEHVSLEPGDKPGDKPRVTVQNFNAVPTFAQFEYHWKAEHSFETRMLNRMQRRRFELAFKPLLTGTLREVRGPGSRYYIDATILDVYCVSRLNRNRIVGRPTLYVVVDQFSRMIVGIYVGLEPPCWAGAMLALWNCCLDKVVFCKQYDIDIEDAQWPTGHMPVHLMGDRGELTSALSDALSQGFGLDVENARPYAGEAKGVAERAFRTAQAKFGPYMPGYVDKEFSGRGAEPAALRSAMNIHEITRVMILAVLYTNIRVIRDYEGWPEIIAAGVPFVPLSLWHWGVENLRCDSRRYDPAYLMRYLWPQQEMKFSRRSLHFYRGLYYMGADLGRQPWYAKAYIENKTLNAAYHPLDVGSVLVFPQDARTGAFDVSLTRRSQRFDHMAFSEVTALENQSRQQNAAAEWDNLAQRANYDRQIHESVQDARKRAAQQADATLSKAGRLKGIRQNRAQEIDQQTGEVLDATLGQDPTSNLVTGEVKETPEEDAQTLDSVQALIQARQQK